MAEILSMFYRYDFRYYSSKLVELLPLPYFAERSDVCSDRLHNFSANVPRRYENMSTPNVFFDMQLHCGISFTANCFPLT